MASSPFAPAGRRNSYYLLRPPPPSSASRAINATTTTTTTIAAVSALLVALRYWNNNRQQASQDEEDDEDDDATPASSFRRYLQNALLYVSDSSPPSPPPTTTSSCTSAPTMTTAVVEEEEEDPPQPTVIAAAAEEVADGTGTAASSSSSSTFRRFRENRALIRDVLRYWFASYPSVEELHKKLWMIPSQSPRRPQVDAEIYEKFGTLLLELAAGTTTTTGETTAQVGAPSSSSSSTRWSEWCGCTVGGGENNNNNNSNNNNSNEDEEEEEEKEAALLYGYEGKLAAIVVLDQFSRHVRRHLVAEAKAAAATAGTEQYRLPDQSALDELALKTAQLFLDRRGVEADDASSQRNGSTTAPPQSAKTIQTTVPIPMLIFALMPFRHARDDEGGKNTKKKAMLEFVQDRIGDMDARIRECDRMVRRFRKATNRRLAVLLDEERRGNSGGGTSKRADEADEPSGAPFSDDDILECVPFQTDMLPSRTHPVHQTICAFLAERGIFPSSSPRHSSAIPILISLSGGVDSMVIARVLSYLSKSCWYRLKITALHIDYANRPESAAEADFCGRYCRDTLGIEFHCRRIDEVTRGVTARDDYERISRQLRFDFYRNSLQQAKSALAPNNDDVEVGVVLGHHRGDLRENVLSNAHKGCGPLDLSGMTAVSQNDGVTLYRPLLSLEKTEVYDYAHKFGVPYFKDTTPHWSTRGKLRNKLLPLLEEIYGEGSMDNLSDLAVESDECRALLNALALSPFLNEVKHKPMGITFATAEWKEQGTFFWKYVLREALHSAGLGGFKDKSTMTFLERIKAPKLREGWLQMRKDYGVYLSSDGRVYIFFPSSFPWSPSAEFKCTGRTVPYGPETGVQVGPWRVTAEKEQLLSADELDANEEWQKRLKQKAVPSMDALMDGYIQYYLVVPTRQTEDARATLTTPTEARCAECDGRHGSLSPSSRSSLMSSSTTSPPLYEPVPLALVQNFSKDNRPAAWKSTDMKLQEKLPLVGIDDAAAAAAAARKNDPDDATTRNPFVAVVKVSIRLLAAE